MTSRKSSKNNFGYAFRTGLAENGIFGALGFIFLSIFYLIAPLSKLVNYTITDETTNQLIAADPKKDFVYFFGYEIGQYGDLMVLAMLLLSCIMGLAAFRFITGKKTVNVYYSLGIRREQLFAAKFLSGAVLLSAAVILPIFSGILVNIAYLGNSAALWQGSMYMMTSLLSVTLIAFSVTAAIFSCVGTLFEGIVFTGSVLLFPTIFLTVIDRLFIRLVKGAPYQVRFSDAYPSLAEEFTFINPILCFANAFKYGGMTTEKTQLSLFGEKIAWSKPSLLLPLCYLVVCIAVFFLGMFLFKRRKAEIGGFLGTCKPLNFAVTFLIGFGAFCLIFNSLAENKWLAVSVGLLAYIVIYCILDFALIRNLREFGKGMVKLPVHLAIVSVILLLFSTGLFGYETRIPNAEDISHAQLSSEGYDLAYTDAYGGLDNFGGYNSTALSPWFAISRGEYTAENDIAFIRALHKAVIDAEDYQVPAADYTPFNTGRIQISYYLKNGKVVRRCYDGVSPELFKKALEAEKTESAQKRLTDLFKGEIKKLPEISKEDYENPFFQDPYAEERTVSAIRELVQKSGNVSVITKVGEAEVTLTENERAELNRRLLADLSAQTVEERYYANNTVGFIRYYLPPVQTDGNVYDGKNFVYPALGTATLAQKFSEAVVLPISEDMTDTLEFLKQLGVYDALTNTPEIQEVYVNRIQNELHKNRAENYRSSPRSHIFIGNRYRKNALMEDGEFGYMAVLKDALKITNPTDCAALYKASGMMAMFEEADYSVYVCTADGNATQLYLRAADVPEGLKTAFQGIVEVPEVQSRFGAYIA